MFLLVQAHPGSPGQRAAKQLLLYKCAVCGLYNIIVTYEVTTLQWDTNVYMLLPLHLYLHIFNAEVVSKFQHTLFE